MLKLKGFFLLLTLFLLSIVDAYAAISARTSSIPTRIYLLRGPSDRIFNAAICEFLVVLFVIMIGIVEVIEKRIQNKIERKPKEAEKNIQNRSTINKIRPRI